MLRRSLLSTSVACLLVSLSGHAKAAGAWIPSGAFEPVEQRVAIAVGPQRTTLWTSLRFQADAGPVGIVVPAPSGSALDFSSDAWFEALEVATAPRIFPPAGPSAYCPGTSGPINPFEIAGAVAHMASPKVDDVTVLDDAAAVSSWASQGGLNLSADALAQLGTLSGVRFVAVRFTAPGGPAMTPTLRIVMPSAPPLLPLSLTRAASTDLRVTTWTLSAGRSQIEGTIPVKLPAMSLAWDAATRKSNYEEVLADELAGEGVSGAYLEAASHEALSTNVSIAGGTASIDGVVTAFFERASAYGDASVNPAPCIAQVASQLSSSALVSASCPRADLGVVDGGPACVESPAPGAVDPANLRCGGSSDDLAVALSGLAPADVWLTRQAMQIPLGKAGASFAVSVPGGPSVSSVHMVTNLDVSGCTKGSSSSSGGMSTGSSMSTGAGSSSSSGLFDGDPGTGSGTGSGGVTGSSGSSSGVDTSCDCSGSPGDVGSDSSDSCSSSDTSSDSCSSSDTSGDSCGSSDTSGGSCDSSGGGDSCSGGGGDTSCDSGGGGDISCDGGGGDCSIGGKGAHRRAPRLSPIALGLLAVVAPLRRRGRRSRQLSAR